jgi:hypothetical protein
MQVLDLFVKLILEVAARNLVLFANEVGVAQAVVDSVIRNLYLECALCDPLAIASDFGVPAATVADVWMSFPSFLAPDAVLPSLADAPPLAAGVVDAIVLRLLGCGGCALTQTEEGCLADATCICRSGFSGRNCSVGPMNR